MKATITPEQAAEISFAQAVRNVQSGRWTREQYRAWWAADFRYRYDDAMKTYKEGEPNAPTR